MDFEVYKTYLKYRGSPKPTMHFHILIGTRESHFPLLPVIGKMTSPGRKEWALLNNFLEEY